MNLRRAGLLFILLFVLAIGLALIVLYAIPPGQRLVLSIAALGLLHCCSFRL
jgi:uncharacterized membrane protein YqjE